ncbi:MAG: hypothetical protein JW714_04840 [Candidatus Omnitrophica bacterium]|nr:hypothetical protein [Candidatus Omnitrophota bacterium]
MDEFILIKEISLYVSLICAILLLIVRLYKRVLAAENEKRSLEGLVTSLLNKYSNRDSILSHYVFDTRRGIYQHKVNGQLYCHKCLLEKTHESPLETQTAGWSCPQCGSFYRNPDK